MRDLNAIKAISIRQVATALGFELSGNSARCKLPDHEDNRPSFYILKKYNTFKCFGCGRAGDAISLVRAMRGASFPEACNWLTERFGAQVHSSAIRRPKERNEVKSLPATAKASAQEDFSEIYSWLLSHSPLQSSGRAYLISREIGDNTQHHFRIGQIGHDSIRSALQAWDINELKRSGLLSASGRGLVFPNKSILVPFFDHGKVIYLQSRNLPPADAKYRWMNPREISKPVFNTDILQEDFSTIALCEGVTDVLSAYELGHMALGFLGATTQLSTVVIEQLRGKNVEIYGDADGSGRKFATYMEKVLASQGLTAITKRFPAGPKDFNDYLIHTRRNQK